MLKTTLLILFLFGISHSLIDVNFTTPFSTAVPQCTEIANDGQSPYLYFVQQVGVIEAMSISNFTMNPIVFLDMREKVFFGVDQGLFGLAFHPNYASNGWFFVFYHTDETNMLLSRFTATMTNGSAIRTANLTSEIVLLKVPLLGGDMGGKLAFYNGSLFISTGIDGHNVTMNGLNTSTLLGKVLRINVENVDRDGKYSIPMDNPLISNARFPPETWAYGFRNPWKFSFDCANGNLYLGDVGIDTQEEIDLVKPGLNYGYPIMEGNFCVNISDCNMTGLTPPLFAYNHTDQSGTVVGGYVYRGSSIPSLFGYYIFGDFMTGQLWALDVDGNGTVQQLSSRIFPTFVTMGEDIYGNLYFTTYSNGTIYRIGDSSSGMLNCMTRNSTSSTLTSSTSSGLSTVTTNSNSNSQSSRFTFPNDESSANSLGFVTVFTLAVVLAFV